MNSDDRDSAAQPETAPNGEAAVQRAKARAARAHHGQLDKAGRPYIEHPERVVGHLVNPTPDEVIVGWLHDVVEDTEVTLQDIGTEFGSLVAAAVDAITRRPGDANGDHYYARIKANPIALKVKAADLADNSDPARLALLDPDEQARLDAKYAHARRQLGIG